MAARSSKDPPAEKDPPTEHVRAVHRAMSILAAFHGDEVFLSLAELARRTGMHKPTALRLARTLSLTRFLVQRADGTWRLGPAAGWIGSRYQAQFYRADASGNQVLKNQRLAGQLTQVEDHVAGRERHPDRVRGADGGPDRPQGRSDRH